MATLGQYAKAQTQTGAAAESGLQALMLLMQYMQQREDRRDEREWRQTNTENIRLQMEQLRLSIAKDRPGAQSFRNIEDVKDGTTYKALDDVLDDLGTITGVPELAQTDAVKDSLKTPLGRTTAMVTERLGIPAQEWSEAWGEVLALRADLAETTKGVDRVRRDQFLREMDAKIKRSLGVDDARYGALAQQALVRHLRQEGWSQDKYSFGETDIAWVRDRHGDDQFISDVLQFNQKKPRWTIDDELRRKESEQAVIDGGLAKVLGDIKEGNPDIVEGIDVAGVEKLDPEIQRQARDAQYFGGPYALADVLLEHAPEPEVDQTKTGAEEYVDSIRDLITRVSREGPAALITPDLGEEVARGLASLSKQGGVPPMFLPWNRPDQAGAPAPTLDDGFHGEDLTQWTPTPNQIPASGPDPSGLGPPAPPGPVPYQAPAGTPEMTPEMMLQLLSGQANAPMAGMGSPPVPPGAEAYPDPRMQEWPYVVPPPTPLSPEQQSRQHGLAPTLGGDVQLEKKFMELQELLEPGSQYAIPGRETSMNPETGREMWPVPADVPRGEQFMGMPMADLAASDQAYETIAAEAQKEHEVNMFMQAMAQKNAIQEAQQRREQISTLLRDASIEEEVLKANKMQLLYDLVGQEAPYYLQRP